MTQPFLIISFVSDKVDFTLKHFNFSLIESCNKSKKSSKIHLHHFDQNFQNKDFIT